MQTEKKNRESAVKYRSVQTLATFRLTKAVHQTVWETQTAMCKKAQRTKIASKFGLFCIGVGRVGMEKVIDSFVWLLHKKHKQNLKPSLHWVYDSAIRYIMCDTWKNLDWRSWIKFSVVEICGKFSAGSGSAINRAFSLVMDCLWTWYPFLSREKSDEVTPPQIMWLSICHMIALFVTRFQI